MKKLLLLGCITATLAGCTFTGANEVAPGEYMITSRSEERRVGKECRSRGSPEH